MDINCPTCVPQLLCQYQPEDVYNADKTGVYYQATPDGSLCYSFEQLSSLKKAMDRVTDLFCTNMTGNDKLKLLFIGKSKKPRCFRSINLDTLPVTYRSNKSTWKIGLLTIIMKIAYYDVIS